MNSSQRYARGHSNARIRGRARSLGINGPDQISAFRNEIGSLPSEHIARRRLAVDMLFERRVDRVYSRSVFILYSSPSYKVRIRNVHRASHLGDKVEILLLIFPVTFASLQDPLMGVVGLFTRSRMGWDIKTLIKYQRNPPNSEGAIDTTI